MVKFILVGHPRTGSSLLREILLQHPQIEMYSELFHPIKSERLTTQAIRTAEGLVGYDDPHEDAFHFLDRMVWNKLNQGRYGAVGFKLFSERWDVEGTHRFFSRIKEDHNDIRIIHLVRDNLMDVWVSRRLAEKSGVWRLPVGTKSNTNDEIPQIDVNYASLKEFFDRTSMMTDFFRSHFGESQYLELNYSQLVTSPQTEIDKIFQFLDVPSNPIKMPLQKQNKLPHTVTVSNYNEIAARFANTQYAKFFEGVMHASESLHSQGQRELPMDENQINKEFRTVARSLSIEQWIDKVGDSLESSQPTLINGVQMPTAPSEELQKTFVNGAGKQTIREAGLFYKFVLETCKKQGIDDIGHLLDFGCGWGRFSRLFLRDVPEGGLIGIDPQYRAIQACRVHVPQASFIKTESYPPLPFRDQFFDVVIANSVFLHLAELPAYAWINEISRILRPGGVLVAATHGPWVLDNVMAVQTGTRKPYNTWEEKTSKEWGDVSALQKKYADGEFAFIPNIQNALPTNIDGNAFVPEQYVRNIWGNYMECVDFVSDPKRISQAAFVLRKKSQ